VEALLPLVEAFSQKGSLVLDPFCGSGSTLVAAQKLNRRYLGIELDTSHHAAASKRLAAASTGRDFSAAAIRCA
jgi:DNA modification methylase